MFPLCPLKWAICVQIYVLVDVHSKGLAKRWQHFNALNISQHCCVQHVACVWPPCCDLLRHLATCWVLLAKFENGQIVTFVDVVWCCTRLARFLQQCYAWACALDWFSTLKLSQQGGQTRATCCAQQCGDLLRLNVAIVWPELAKAVPTILGYVALRCCHRLAGALEIW